MTVKVITEREVRSVEFHGKDITLMASALDVARHKLESVAGPAARELHDWCASVTNGVDVSNADAKSRTFDTGTDHVN